MSLLDSVISGKQVSAPPRIVIYGYEGVGKSCWASQAPNPIFVQTEDGLKQINCNRLPLSKSYKDVIDALAAIRDEKHDFQTVVIDSLSNLESLIHEEVCREYGVRSIEKAAGGFGKGYIEALKYWKALLDILDEINNKRSMLVILTAHVGVQPVKDPENQPYDRTSPDLNRLASGLITKWADCVFQAKQQFRVQKLTDDKAIAMAVGSEGGERVIRTIGSVAVIAKNRYDLPEYLPLDFNAFLNAIQK